MALTRVSRHMRQEEVFSVPGYGYLGTISHFNITSIVTDKFFHKIEVYKMGIMRAKKIPVIKQILKFFEMF